MKIKKIVCAVLCVLVMAGLYGCSLLEEQWEIVEKYRLENTTTEKKKVEKATTQELKKQEKLEDFINEDAMTLADRIDTPNGYTRVGEEKQSKKKAKKTTQKATTQDKTTKEKVAKDKTTQETTQKATTQARVLTASEAMQNTTTENKKTDVSGEASVTTEDITAKRDNTSGKVYTIEEFMRNLDVKKADEKVMLYNGQEKEKQEDFAAVLNLKLDNKNLQQKASSMMRLYAEYYWTNKDYANMKYHLTNGFEMDYETWISGKRLMVDNNTANWYDAGVVGDNYATLLAYLEYYFCYSGMTSLEKDSKQADIKDIQVGDYFLDEKKENAAMVVDVAKDSKGNQCFLLAAGGSPGQDIVILKNPKHEDPWYYVSEIDGEFETPEFKLDAASCRHLKTTDDSEDKGE